MARRVSHTVCAAASVMGNSWWTWAGGLSSLMALMRRSSVCFMRLEIDPVCRVKHFIIPLTRKQGIWMHNLGLSDMSFTIMIFRRAGDGVVAFEVLDALFQLTRRKTRKSVFVPQSVRNTAGNSPILDFTMTRLAEKFKLIIKWLNDNIVGRFRARRAVGKGG